MTDLAVRGIRGATTVTENNKIAILKETRELLINLKDKNRFETEEIVSIFFSMTPDLNAAFPAAAARQLGWNNVPLFGVQESDVENTLKMCIRILIHINTNKLQGEIKHCYLNKAVMLRKDLMNKDEESKNDSDNG